jgi:hypothetical protein
MFYGNYQCQHQKIPKHTNLAIATIPGIKITSKMDSLSCTYNDQYCDFVSQMLFESSMYLMAFGL